jgi:hypothetical protein
VDGWREYKSMQTLCPEGLPAYLNDLFCSNFTALLAIFSSQRVNVSPAS